MNYLLIFSTTLLFGFSSSKDSPNSFDYRLTTIAQAFKQEIMNKDECEKLKEEASDLKGDIENDLYSNNEYSPDEINELKKLKEEAEALEGYIEVVGNCGNDFFPIEHLHLANKRIGGSITALIKDKYCVDVITVTIGRYIAYLGENNSTKDYKVSYNWYVPKGIISGSGKMVIESKTVRRIYDNREDPKQERATISGITCLEYYFLNEKFITAPVNTY